MLQVDGTSVAILGAGFSLAATNGQMPLMGTFFDQLLEVNHPELFSFIQQTSGDVAHANVESVLLAIDQICASPEGVLIGWGSNWKREAPTIRKQLSLYTLGRLRICEKFPNYGNWAQQVVGSLNDATTVISMNYDTITDQILSNRVGMIHRNCSSNPTCPHCKMGLLLEKACSCAMRRDDISESDWRGSLIKLHGSIAWKRCCNTQCCLTDCLVADQQCQPYEPCECEYCSQLCEPVLVMPSMNKRLDEIPEIRIMWQAARLALEQASRILIFGFSMPESDKILEILIRESLSKNLNLKLVACVDCNPTAVLERFKRCVPSSAKVEFRELPVAPPASPTWFGEFYAMEFCRTAPYVLPMTFKTRNGNSTSFAFAAK